MYTFKFQALFAVVALFQFMVCAFGQQPDLVSFGDFMEFFLGIHSACANATDGPGSISSITDSFTHCINSLGSNEPREDYISGMAVFCKHRTKYFDCWDKMKSDTLNKCGHEKAKHLPKVYHATLFSLCGNDNGAKTIENLKKASAEMKPEDKDNCSEETGIHWLDNCKASLTTMISPDLCARHEAINKCVQKITCDNFDLAKLMRKIYSDGQLHLDCYEGLARASASKESFMNIPVLFFTIFGLIYIL